MCLKLKYSEYLPNKVCVPNKTEDLNLCVFNMITGINQSKAITKHISYECKCRFHGKKFNQDQWWNNNTYRRQCKKHHPCEKDYIWNPPTYSCENGKFLASIMNDSAITCDNIRESCKKETNFNEKKATSNMQNFYILLAFLLNTVALLRPVSIYCYLKKYQAKQKHLLPFHDTSYKLKQVFY